MHIAIDGRSAFFYRGSGVGNYSYELIKNIFKINSSNLIHIHSNPIPKTYKSFWELSNTPLVLTKHYDTFLNPHNGIGLPKNNSEKIITTLHDIIPSKLPETVSPTYLKIYNENIFKTLEKSHKILTVSNFSKNDISKTFNINKDKIHVTYLAPSKIYKPINKNLCRNFLKKFYNINFNYVLYIGGFSPRKNILGLIEGFSKLRYKIPNIKLLIVGFKGISYENYFKRCCELNLYNDVIFTGFIPTYDLPFFYNGAKCFIYPSFYEGFGLPPLEAMACKIPVITSKVTSMPEVLKDAPIYIDPYNVDDIYEGLYNLLKDSSLQKKAIKNSLNHVKNFSWEKTSKKTLEFICKN